MVGRKEVLLFEKLTSIYYKFVKMIAATYH